MSESLYERYRDALRGGHVAALRGHRPIAARAYLEAAALLPDRAAPYLGLGRVELDGGRPAEALAAFEAALARAPNDPAALDGCARALLALDRRADAADLLDRLAIVHLEAGRDGEALATVERALELAESRWRRRALERLRVGRPEPTPGWIGDLPPDDRPPAGGVPQVGDAAAREAAERAAAIAAGVRELALRVEVASAAGDVEGLLSGALELARADRVRAAIDACHDALSVTPAEPAVHRALASIYRRRGWDEAARRKLALIDRYLAVIDDPIELDQLADAAEAAGAIDGLLSVVERHARQGRHAAALEVAFRAIALAPADPRVHLSIARVHLALGWRDRALDSVTRLWQLVELTGDQDGRERIASFVANELPRGRGGVSPAA
jgi:tetratricopeptide (TPR) repeat protein